MKRGNGNGRSPPLKSRPLIARAGGPLTGSVEIPGDQATSLTAIVLAAMAEGASAISGLGETRDTLAAIEAIRAFGASARRYRESGWEIIGARWVTPSRAIDCGGSRTAAMLLMSGVAGFPVRAIFSGDAALLRQSMEPAVRPLQALGATILPRTATGLPLAVHGGGLGSLSWHDDQASADAKSVVLIAGLRAAGEIRVRESRPSSDMVERLIAAFGGEIAITREREDRIVRLGARRELAATRISVSADPVLAGLVVVAASIVPGSIVTVRNVMLCEHHGGLFASLAQMGGQLNVATAATPDGGLSATITARHAGLGAIEVPSSRIDYLAEDLPALCVAAAMAQGRTLLRGIGALTGSAGARIRLTFDGLRACGIEANLLGDDAEIWGTSGRGIAGGVAIRSGGDPYVGMAFLVLGLNAREAIMVDHGLAIAARFPHFVREMIGIGAGIAAA